MAMVKSLSVLLLSIIAVHVLSKGDALMDIFTEKLKQIGSCLGTGEQNLLCLRTGVSLTQGSV